MIKMKIRTKDKRIKPSYFTVQKRRKRQDSEEFIEFSQVSNLFISFSYDENDVFPIFFDQGKY
jgi:hypothetical protein